MNITDNIQKLADSMEKARLKSQIAAKEVVLLAASKAQTALAIEEVIKGGICNFGENRVQEAEAKWTALKKKYPDIKLHLIGPLQTNKVKHALALFDVIQSLDREGLAEEIIRIRDCGFRIQGKEFYIQVNTGAEPQKAGVAPEKADGFIDFCKKLELPVVGLMCVPPHDQPPAPHFALLREIALRNGLEKLSMGMSNDFEAALRMGSTCVRIGTALFGERD